VSLCSDGTSLNYRRTLLFTNIAWLDHSAGNGSARDLSLELVGSSSRSFVAAPTAGNGWAPC